MPNRVKPQNSSSRKRRILFTSALSLTLLTAFGVVSGTIAWYQYSTLASLTFIGTSVKGSKILQISCDGGNTWKSELSSDDIRAAIGEDIGSALLPITPGNQAKEAALSDTFYLNPVYQKTSYAYWQKADTTNYLSFDLQFRVTDGSSENALVDYDNELYLSDFVAQADSDSPVDGDISAALRVHIASASESKYHLVSKNGGETLTSGNLDLDGDGALDTGKKYEWEEEGTPLVYGDEGSTETSYAPSQLYPTVNEDKSLSGESLGTIPASSTLTLTITTWIEGWQTFDSSAVWDVDTYAGAMFDLGLSFEVSSLLS